MYIKQYIFSFVFLINFTVNSFAQTKQITVVIDPGHGGRDPGKPKGSSNAFHEKDINLGISLKLGQYITQNIPQVKVIYTRNKDVYVSLEDRVKIANNNKAAVFISIHANSNPKKHIHGTETHIYSRKMKASYQLALMIENEFKQKAGRHSRGVIDADERGRNLYVTQYTDMPSVLVETGYLTNMAEEKYLNSEDGQAVLASAIYRAFRDFVRINHAIEDRSKIYQVQIMASQKRIEIDASVFADLEDKVIEQVSSKDEKYKYKYVIGREYDESRAIKLANKIAKLGFPDAFVIEVK
jgi:N-acetylmuramoyl-L-alanine amidase